MKSEKGAISAVKKESSSKRLSKTCRTIKKRDDIRDLVGDGV